MASIDQKKIMGNKKKKENDFYMFDFIMNNKKV